MQARGMPRHLRVAGDAIAALSQADRSRAMLLFAEDFEFCAQALYRIITKDRKMVPFKLNRAQRHIDEQLNRQLSKEGRVRALILKARQQGCSTYIAARFYHKVTMRYAMQAYIMAHEDKATANLFRMVKFFHTNMPPEIQIRAGATNAKELIFPSLNGGYRLATAGASDTGRSATVHLFHGSEVAFWRGLPEHLAGIGNTVPDAPGTEVILETTARGEGTPFHALWTAAERGENEYQAIFVPWLWQDEYRAKVDSRVKWSEEEAIYASAYGATPEQMMWRRKKIASYGPGNAWLFDQEYPATPALAFRTSTSAPYIDPALVARAANSRLQPDPSMPLVVGVDPAEYGRDRTAIVFRRGRVVFRVEVYRKKSTMEVVGIVGKIAEEYHPDLIVIDRTGIGAGVVDRCMELGYPVMGVHSGSAATKRDIYANKRAEMWAALLEWLENEPNRIVDNAEIRTDIVSPCHTFDSSRRMLIEKKEDMAKRGVRSPDLADALALTFAFNVMPRELYSSVGGMLDVPSIITDQRRGIGAGGY